MHLTESKYILARYNEPQENANTLTPSDYAINREIYETAWDIVFYMLNTLLEEKANNIDNYKHNKEYDFYNYWFPYYGSIDYLNEQLDKVNELNLSPDSFKDKLDYWMTEDSYSIDANDDLNLKLVNITRVIYNMENHYIADQEDRSLAELRDYIYIKELK